MRNALLAGTFVALACGVSGWFVVLRGQVFAGDALSHVAFPGALAAAAAGIDERVGLFAATIAVGAGIGVLSRARSRAAADGRSGAGRRHGDRDRVHVHARAGRVLPDAVQHELRRRLGHPGRAHPVRVDLRPRRRRSAPGGGDRARGGARDARDRPPAAVRLDLPRRGRPRGACRRGCSASASSCCWGSSRPRRPRRWGRCCCSGCSPPRPPPRTGLHGNPYAGIALAGLLAVVAMWGGLALGYAVPGLPPSTAIVTIAVGIYYVSTLVA